MTDTTTASVTLTEKQVATLTALATQERQVAATKHAYLLAIAEGAGIPDGAVPDRMENGVLTFTVPPRPDISPNP